jgi:hypothetical protein
MSGQITYTEAERLAIQRAQKTADPPPNSGAKQSGKNSDAKEYYGVGCPCGWRFGKQDQQRTTERALRLHTKVCKVAQEVQKRESKHEYHSVVCVRGELKSSSYNTD